MLGGGKGTKIYYAQFFPAPALSLVPLHLLHCGGRGSQFTSTPPQTSLKAALGSTGRMKTCKESNGLGLQSSAARRHKKSLPVLPLM